VDRIGHQFSASSKTPGDCRRSSRPFSSSTSAANRSGPRSRAAEGRRRVPACARRAEGDVTALAELLQRIEHGSLAVIELARERQPQVVHLAFLVSIRQAPTRAPEGENLRRCRPARDQVGSSPINSGLCGLLANSKTSPVSATSLATAASLRWVFWLATRRRSNA
jgi:hypothetical protein